MKQTLIAENRQHLQELIQKEIQLNGYQCDLNHINVSQINDMSALFFHNEFNGDISKWDVSNVISMHKMFQGSKFNGEIGQWNTSKVKDMYMMFYNSKFNRDISRWDVSNVKVMYSMFCNTEFSYDISNWLPYSLGDFIRKNELNCPKLVPYWAEFETQELRNKAIETYKLREKLGQELVSNNIIEKRIKI